MTFLLAKKDLLGKTSPGTFAGNLNSFLSVIVNYVSIAPTEEGGGVRETNYIYEIPAVSHWAPVSSK